MNSDPIGKVRIKEVFRVKAEDFVILYSGNLGRKQGLECIPELAVRFSNAPNVQFVVCGEGAMKQYLEEKAQYMPNLQIHSLQPYELLPRLLNSADLHLVLQKKEVSDLVLPSKLTGLLACGANALVTATKESELGKIAEEYPGIYTLVNPDDLDALGAAIENVTHHKREVNAVARSYALKYLNKGAILEQFESDAISLIQDNKSQAT